MHRDPGFFFAVIMFQSILLKKSTAFDIFRRDRKKETEMDPKPIHDPAEGPLRIVALMSGSGTNVRRILQHGRRIEQQEGAPLYQVVLIFSDNWESKAPAIGAEFDVPVLVHDLRGWMQKHGVERKELRKRERFDKENVEMIKPFDIKVAVYGGYMSIASPTLVKAFRGVNVHPADLSVKTPDGRRKWTGAHAVRDAIAAGEKHIRSSTHLVEREVDMGPLLMISAPLEVVIPEGMDANDPGDLAKLEEMNQERLKQAGDWVIFPRTIEAIARGWFQTDEEGGVYYRGKPAPDGVFPQ